MVVFYTEMLPLIVLTYLSYILVQGRVLDSWGVEHNAAAPPPQSPVKSLNQLELITLIPFGATDLRIAEFPVLDEQ